MAMNYHLVARAHSCKGDFRTALQYEKEAYSIYKTAVRFFLDVPFFMFVFMYMYLILRNIF